MTSGWSGVPRRMTLYPSSASCFVKRCARSTSEQVASMHSRPRSSIFARTSGGTPWARITTMPSAASAGSLITLTPSAESRSLILGLWTTCPRLYTGRPVSAAASVSSTAFLTPKQNPFSRARSTSIRLSLGGRGHPIRVFPTHLGREQFGDAEHDRVRGRLPIALYLRREIGHAERLPEREHDLGPADRSRARRRRPDDGAGDDQRVAALGEQRDARPAAQERPRLAAVTLGEHPQRQSSLEHPERELDGTAIRLAATHREVADPAQQEPDDRVIEDLDLGHPADRRAERERYRRRVLPVDVIGREHVRPGRRDILPAAHLDARQEEHDEADRRHQETPQPELRHRRHRRLGEEPLDHVVVMMPSTLSSAWPTDRPSVCTTTASSAALSGATARSLSSLSRRRISCNSS